MCFIRAFKHCSYIFFAIIFFSLAGCTFVQEQVVSFQDVPSYTINGRTISAEQAKENIDDFDLLAINAEVIDFTDHYVSKDMTKLQRAAMLHQVLASPAFRAIEYHGPSTLTAQQAFDLRQANCLGYANLYIALSRHYGLKASYQLIEKFPEWSMTGNLVSMNVHINTMVPLNSDKGLVVELGGNGFVQQGERKVISDNDALALFYNNLAITAYANEDNFQAYSLIAKAIAFSPRQALLWSNLGAVFRATEQYEAAESVLKTALRIDSGFYTALNNLSIVYHQTGQKNLYAEIAEKTQQLRIKNPYYYYYLARKSVQEKDYRLATRHLKRALRIKDDEPRFHQLMEEINSQRDQVAQLTVNAY